jgi:hypothetical protein
MVRGMVSLYRCWFPIARGEISPLPQHIAEYLPALVDLGGIYHAGVGGVPREQVEILTSLAGIK